MTANLSASVKDRLQKLAKETRQDFNLTLTRYGIERLLYRLSVSTYSDKFLLKGAMLFALWDAIPNRPTRDVDLLGFLPSEADALVSAFHAIVQTDVEPDGLAFDPASITAGEIREGNTYGGIRMKLMAMLGSARIPIQIDVGAGDAVTPEPAAATFPTLLDFPAPQLRAYPVYTAIAEKLEAAVTLKEANTRMKDFFDLWFLFRRFDLDSSILQEAIKATFARRQTPLPIPPDPFSDRLATDPIKQTQWAAFLRRNNLAEAPSEFRLVVNELSKRLAQIDSEKTKRR